MAATYEFLELVKESEAAIKGSQVSEKIHHSIYKTIHSLSNISSIRAGKVYTLKVPIKELQVLEIPKNNYLSVLRNLINDKLIQQLCIFNFNDETKELNIISCYISLPTTDETNIQSLYTEILQYSIKSIIKYINNRPLVKKQNLFNEFELDFKQLNKPPLEKLPNTIFDPTYLIIPSAFDINPEPQVLNTIKKDLRNELTRQKYFTEIFEYGLLTIRDEEISIRYETADEFMRLKIIQKYKSDGELKTKLDAIFLEESAYYIEPFVPKSTEYSLKIAETIKSYNSEKNKNVRFPGLLTIEYIRSLSKIVNDIYQQQYKNDVYKEIQFYLDKLKFLATQSMDEVVLYLYQDELEQINSKVIDALKNSNEIMYLQWYLKKDIVYIFAYKDPEIFHKIVANLLENINNIQTWKILALKFLIEQYEDEFPDLFKNNAFKEAYGKLLRKVYIHFMPWYFKILIYINFPFFQDIAFQQAKEKILNEQNILQKENLKILEEKKLIQIQEKKEKLARAKDINTLVRIMDKVYSYLKEGKIPYLESILQELTGWEEKDFIEYLKNQQFVLYNINNKQVILYAKNLNWKISAIKMHQIITQNLQLKNLDSKVEMEVRNNKNELTKIRSFIEAKLKNSPKSEVQEEDPFKTFNKVIEKEKMKEKLNITSDELEI